METQIETKLLLHKDRIDNISNFSQLENPVIIVDTLTQGATIAHIKALSLVDKKATHLLVLEDDAILCTDFYQRVEEWVHRFPTEMISFYLGTGRPKSYINHVSKLIEETNADYIELDQLIHGVGYIFPTTHLDQMINYTLGKEHSPADFLVGQAWKSASKKKRILYTYPSLVDHLDTPPVEKHPDGEKRIEKRKARFFVDNKERETNEKD